MSNINYPVSLVRDEFKHEYQEGTVNEVKINCANNKYILVSGQILLRRNVLRRNLIVNYCKIFNIIIGT